MPSRNSRFVFEPRDYELRKECLTLGYEEWAHVRRTAHLFGGPILDATEAALDADAVGGMLDAFARAMKPAPAPEPATVKKARAKLRQVGTLAPEPRRAVGPMTLDPALRPLIERVAAFLGTCRRRGCRITVKP